MRTGIRQAEVTDVPAIATFQTDCWKEAYAGLVPQTHLDTVTSEMRAARWDQRIRLKLRTVWLAEQGVDLRGVVSRTIHPTGVPELSSLYVDKTSRGTGLGKRLVQTALGDNPAFLWVFEKNVRAIGFYRKLGFEHDGSKEMDADTGVWQVKMVRPRLAAHEDRATAQRAAARALRIFFVQRCTEAYHIHMSMISATAARQTLPAQLDRVEAGEEVAITRHGRIVAVLVRPDVLKLRRVSEAWSRADDISALLDSARDEPLRPAAISPERAEKLLEAVRTNRASRWAQ